MTPLHKPVTRKTDAHVRDQGKERRIIVTLYPGKGTLGLRPERTRREELVSLAAVYEFAVKMRVQYEQREQALRKKRNAKTR